jgi:hypothetical protein
MKPLGVNQWNRGLFRAGVSIQLERPPAQRGIEHGGAHARDCARLADQAQRLSLLSPCTKVR